MMNVCRAKPNVSPVASSFEKPSSAWSAIFAACDEEHEDEEQSRGADETELRASAE